MRVNLFDHLRFLRLKPEKSKVGRPIRTEIRRGGLL